MSDTLVTLSEAPFTLAPAGTKTIRYSYTVTQADVDAGKIDNTATATGKDPKGADVTDDDNCTVATEEKNAHLTVSKVSTSTAPETGYAVGDTISYRITVRNDGNVTIHGISISDELEGFTFDEGQKISGITLVPGESSTATGSYTVTEADVIADNVVNKATATGKDPENDDPEVVPDTTIDPTEDPDGHLTIKKVTTSEPKNGETYALGEEISYKITVTNDGNLTIRDIKVTDDLTGDKWTIDALAPGAGKDFKATYTVAEKDILAGEVMKVATATGKSPDPDEPDVQVVPGRDPEPTEDPNGHITINKTTTSEPADGKAYTVGETISYSITATNDGNLTITDIQVTDELTNDKWNVSKLTPGESKTFTAKYTVTEADILAGGVKNVATAKGTSPDPDKPDVSVDPGKKEDPTQDKNPHLTVSKTTTSNAPAGGYRLGDTISYRITVKNDGNVTIDNITVTDTVAGYNAEDISSRLNKTKLAPGEEAVATFEHVVTEQDILAGSVKNEATAKGKDPEKEDPKVVPGTTDDPTESQKPALSVTKKANRTRGFEQGDQVTYTITVRNTGNVTLRNINVADSLVRFSGNTGTIDSLAPGTTATLTYRYTVTAANVTAGEVVNTATARGTAPNGTTPTGSDSVTVRTQGTPDDGGAPAGGNPAGGAANVVPPAPGPGPAPAPADTVIPDEPVPEVEPEIDIVDPEPPLAEGTWALINLISAILTTLGAAAALFRKKEEDDEEEDDQEGAKKAKDEEEDEDDNRGKKMLAAKIAGAVAGVAAPITFILTEDMSLPMAMTDKWTLLMLVMLAAQVVAAVLNKKASKLDDEEENAEAAN